MLLAGWSLGKAIQRHLIFLFYIFKAFIAHTNNKTIQYFPSFLFLSDIFCVFSSSQTIVVAVAVAAL